MANSQKAKVMTSQYGFLLVLHLYSLEVDEIMKKWPTGQKLLLPPHFVLLTSDE